MHSQTARPISIKFGMKFLAIGCALIYDNAKSSNHSVISQLRLPSENRARRTAEYVTTSPAFADAQEGQPLVQETSQPHPKASSSSVMHNWVNLVLRKELLLTRISTFTESPEAYRGWKQTFLNTVRELQRVVSAKNETAIMRLRLANSCQLRSTTR